jgi:serine/threonine-protein kinase
MEDWTGKSIGRFRLTALIGQEPGRASYRAEEAGTGESVAVTIIPPPTADDRWFADRVARGLRPYTVVTHPQLLPLREVGEEDGVAYAVTPLA